MRTLTVTSQGLTQANENLTQNLTKEKTEREAERSRMQGELEETEEALGKAENRQKELERQSGALKEEKRRAEGEMKLAEEQRQRLENLRREALSQQQSLEARLQDQKTNVVVDQEEKEALKRGLQKKVEETIELEQRQRQSEWEVGEKEAKIWEMSKMLEALQDDLDYAQDDLKRKSYDLTELLRDPEYGGDMYDDLHGDFIRIQSENHQLRDDLQGLKSEMELKTLELLRVKGEMEMLKVEQEKQAKEQEQVRKAEMEIWKLQELAKIDESREQELKLAIAKKRQGLEALNQEVDVTPPDWNASWPSVGAFSFDHRLDEGTLQLDKSGSSRVATTLSIKEKPFAKGSFRFAYYGMDGGHRMVFKKLIFSQDFEKDLRDHEDNLKLHMVASYYADEFNRAKPYGAPRISYVKARIYSYRDNDGSEACVFGEEVLEGKFTKYNSNEAYVNPDPEADLPQTFSHFTYIHSGRKLVICDIQGCYYPGKREFLMTDPACNKIPVQGEAREFGESNLGEKGLNEFFAHHRCNQFCYEMNLAPHPSQT